MEKFTDFTPVQLASAREAVRDMLFALGGYYSVERIQKIADKFQFSFDEVLWLLSNQSNPMVTHGK